MGGRVCTTNVIDDLATHLDTVPLFKSATRHLGFAEIFSYINQPPFDNELP
jgi:hypothetical protein